MAKEIKVGSKVIVVNSGNTYTNYKEKFKEFKFNNTEVNRELPNGTICEVFAIGAYGGSIDSLTGISDNKMFAVQDQDGNQALLGSRGVILAAVKETNNNDQFDLLTDFCTELRLDITPIQIFKYLLNALQK